MQILPPTRIEACRKVRAGFESRAFLNVWEGAVRSGKTVFALMAFANYVISSSGTAFLLSGRTVKTIEKNTVLNDFGLLNLIPGSKYKKIGESRAVVFRTNNVTKTISVVGASDIRAYMQIRGNTYSGWFADEINMHDKSFVEEALRRTAMSVDRRHYWTLNPDAPMHWIYTEYLDRYSNMDSEGLDRLGGFKIWQYVPRDNPAMTPKMIASLEEQYPKNTYLYDRYVLGKRCVAEGLIFPLSVDNFFRDFEINPVVIKYCGIDFGTNHPTTMVFFGTFLGNKNDWRMVAEYFDEKSDKTTYDHYVGFLQMCKKLHVDPRKINVAIDPAANVLRKEFLQRGIPVVRAKNAVLPGIDFLRKGIYAGHIIFHNSMIHSKKEFGTYSWNEKLSAVGEDKPIKIGDDCIDAIRYGAFTFIEPVVKW
ncbi:MAG: terminase family protein [Victivallales bacterium]